MNDAQIENLLRKTPRLRAPDGLRERLQSDISLPRVRTNGTPHVEAFWRRWVPALSFGVLLLGCLIALAMQTSQLLELRRENELLRAGVTNLDQLREDNAEVQRLRGTAPDQARLQQEHEDLLRLRAEATQLRAQTGEMAALRAENKRLQAEQGAAAARAGAATEDDPFAAASEKAMRIQCVNYLKNIGLAARVWANDQGDVLPGDFLTMSNELSTAKILICPADKAHNIAKNWQEFNASNASYELLSPGATVTDVQVLYARCPIHNNVLLVDGSVQQIDAKRFRIEKIDGKFKLKVVITPEESQP
jgi:hypothetical protein